MPYIEQDNVYKLWNYTNFNANRGRHRRPATISWRVDPDVHLPVGPGPGRWTPSDAATPPRHWALTTYRCNAGTRSYRRADQTNDGPFIHCNPRKFADITDGTQQHRLRRRAQLHGTRSSSPPVTT